MLGSFQAWSSSWSGFKISQEVCEYFEKLISSRKSTCIFLLEISEWVSGFVFKGLYYIYNIL